MKSLISILIVALAILSACNDNKTNPKDEAILVEARQIHSQAFKVHNEVMPQIKAIVKYKRELLKAEKKDSSLIAQIDAQDKAMKEWMTNVQEVAGEKEGDHDHEGHDHKHDHAPSAKVSPKEMLAYQKQMKADIEKIKTEVMKILAKK